MSGGLGFIAGYLFTSVYLTVVLDLTEQSLSLDAVAAGLSAEERSALMADVDIKPDMPAAKLDRTSGAVRKLQDLAVDLSASDSSLELLGNAKLRGGKFQNAVLVFFELIRRDAACYRFYRSLAVALYRWNRIPEAVETLERARPLVVSELEAFYEFLTRCCLRVSYRKCILYAEEFFALGLEGAAVSRNYACAFGLKAREKLKADPNANIDEEAAAARKALGQAKLDDPALEVFRNRPEFADVGVS
jgi:tetratricopeptide (TPR) repeat protein